ncbi:MAG: hypothetical protein COT91_03330 [Candidatus Doudnabacteria bacterium CG10_big_fil_rev_8_21_14_0_10_41_10]|uniref:Uncharacterized protein n=1 Tax=Candidatus Doudnabacteria bacterium CG10_big_fil_rev_8_21_14_0_10_41_10 TaxID=1974551 RepID=A0A2H0VDC0_9BACT|nr:MAG: hypothetical protein COT91_03330 [Candidatus Doudnabacteria bacterium CG10_big_fil_rev_8_21_14_0_10_41_10]
MYFDLGKAPIRFALRLEKVSSTKATHRLVLFMFVVLVFLMIVWLTSPELLGEDRIFGLFLMATSFAFTFWVYSLFFTTYLKNLERPKLNEDNLACYLDFLSAKTIESYQKSSRHDISALLFSMLKNKQVDFILYRIGINPKTFEEHLKNYLKYQKFETQNEEFIVFLEDALQEARDSRNENIITWRDLLVSLSAHSKFFNKFLFNEKLEKGDIRRLASWQWRMEEDFEKTKKFWSKENLMGRRGIAKDWAAGYTVQLDKYARDVTYAIAKRGFSAHLYGRKNETDAIERILARAGENNVVLVGEAGVGKKTIAYALSKRILDGKVLPSLAHKRVLELDIGSVLAGSGSSHEVELKLKNVLNDAVSAGNVILLIDEIHSIFSRDAGAGQINATELFLPYLSSPNFQVIGMTDFKNYQRTFGSNPSLVKDFEKVEIHEPQVDDVISILEDAVPQIEAHSQVLVTYQAMVDSAKLSDRYIKDVPFPEKALDVLEEAAIYAKADRKSSLVTSGDVEEVVYRRTEIPVGKIAMAEKEVLLDLEKVLHRKVIGQSEAITAVANALRRSRSGIASEKKPIGSFLFLGPTGVGKTETAKALASTYFGSVKSMLRFDMSEFQQADSVKRLLGDGAEPGQLTTAIIDNPFSLLLLDEIEKADSNILNLFLQVLDDGRLTGSSGRTVDFTNTIIIMTSNAGSEMIRQSVEQMREQNLKERLLDYLQKEGRFRPEFLNRFDAVIVYKPLTQDQTWEVTKLLFSDLNRRLKQKDVQLKITDELVAKVSKLGYSPEFGARPLRRVIQDKVENIIAKKLLSGEVDRGDVVEIQTEELV